MNPEPTLLNRLLKRIASTLPIVVHSELLFLKPGFKTFIFLLMTRLSMSLYSSLKGSFFVVVDRRSSLSVTKTGLLFMKPHVILQSLLHFLVGRERVGIQFFVAVFVVRYGSRDNSCTLWFIAGTFVGQRCIHRHLLDVTVVLLREIQRGTMSGTSTFFIHILTGLSFIILLHVLIVHFIAIHILDHLLLVLLVLDLLLFFLFALDTLAALLLLSALDIVFILLSMILLFALDIRFLCLDPRLLRHRGACVTGLRLPCAVRPRVSLSLVFVLTARRTQILPHLLSDQLAQIHLIEEGRRSSPHQHLVSGPLGRELSVLVHQQSTRRRGHLVCPALSS
mmetsp:Transcript_24040/g.60165  ORF Transcript_24040/g.60165 Transcript_24040/m.60165 type:complete len:337 (+) Transcript_24040:197-1207(+)